LKKDGRYDDDDLCWRGGDVLIVGIAANYAAVAADTFSSELGILAKGKPRLITAPWRVVPPGTNGGVTLTGLGAGALGAYLIALTSTLLMPFCKDWTFDDKAKFTWAIAIAGFSGTLLDSLLGAIFQASVIDIHSGKVIEGEGGRKVLVHDTNPLHLKQRAKARSSVISHEEGKDAIAKSSGVDKSTKSPRKAQEAKDSGIEVADGLHESRKVAVGYDILDNNAVNILMAALVSVGSMVAACVFWDLPLSSIIAV
jgi:uncharacterized membrane protein